jgi:leader peptidase (prepilin peptidase)/N-methyltransferase
LLGVGVNVAADRLADGGGRCDYCGRRWEHGGAWAVITALRRQGACPACGAPLPWRPVLVELVCAAGLPLLWRKAFAGGDLAAALDVLLLVAYLLVLLLVSVTDLEQRRIPNVVIYPALALALAGAFLRPPGNWRDALGGGAASCVFFLLLYGLGMGFARLLGWGRRALGAGDVKLATFIGLATGLHGVGVALALGILAAAVVAAIQIVVQLLRRQYRPGRTMPYGHFLAGGAALVLLLAS